MSTDPGIFKIIISFYSNIPGRQDKPDKSKNLIVQRKKQITNKNIPFKYAGEVKDKINDVKTYQLKPSMIFNENKTQYTGNSFYVTSQIERELTEITQKEKFFTNREYLRNELKKILSDDDAKQSSTSSRGRLGATGSGKINKSLDSNDEETSTQDTSDEETWILAEPYPDIPNFIIEPRRQTRKRNRKTSQQGGQPQTRRAKSEQPETNFLGTKKQNILNNINYLLKFFLKKSNVLYLNDRVYKIERYSFRKNPTINISAKIVQISLNIRVGKYTKPVQYSSFYKPSGFDKKVQKFHEKYTGKCKKNSESLLDTYDKLKKQFQEYRDRVLQGPASRTTDTQTDTQEVDEGDGDDDKKKFDDKEKLENIFKEALRNKREEFREKGLLEGKENQKPKDTASTFEIGPIYLSNDKKEELKNKNSIETRILETKEDKAISNTIALNQNNLYYNIQKGDRYPEKKRKVQDYRSKTTKELEKKLKEIYTEQNENLPHDEKRLNSREINEKVRKKIDTLGIRPLEGAPGQVTRKAETQTSDILTIAPLAKDVYPDYTKLATNQNAFFVKQDSSLNDLSVNYKNIFEKTNKYLKSIKDTGRSADFAKPVIKRYITGISKLTPEVKKFVSNLKKVYNQYISFCDSLLNKQDKIQSEIGEERKNKVVQKLEKFRKEVVDKKNNLPRIEDSLIFTAIPIEQGKNTFKSGFIDKDDINKVADIWFKSKNNKDIQDDIKYLGLSVLPQNIELKYIKPFKIPIDILGIKKQNVITITPRIQTSPPSQQQPQSQQQSQPQSQQQPQQPSPFIGIYNPIPSIQVIV